MLAGIDVSHYQRGTDWARVAGAGVTFAYLKATEGVTIVDESFIAHHAGARARGLLVGAYHFFRPQHDGLEQAERFLLRAEGTPGEDLPHALDLEVLDGVAPELVLERAIAWLDAVRIATDVVPILYTGPGLIAQLGHHARAFALYPLWLADYRATPTIPRPWSRWTIWQHSGSGRVAGVPGDCDLDSFDGTLEELRALADSADAATLLEAPAVHADQVRAGEGIGADALAELGPERPAE